MRFKFDERIFEICELFKQEMLVKYAIVLIIFMIKVDITIISMKILNIAFVSTS